MKYKKGDVINHKTDYGDDTYEIIDVRDGQYNLLGAVWNCIKVIDENPRISLLKRKRSLRL